MKFSLIICLVGFLLSCCPSQKASERRISRLVKCNPSLVSKDSLTIRDTTYIDSIRIQKDTFITPLDTFYFEKDDIKLKFLLGKALDSLDRYRDSLNKVPFWFDITCPPDTVYLEKTVPTTQINVEDKPKKWWYFLIAAFILFLLFIFNRK